jgi:hypothetical protein
MYICIYLGREETNKNGTHEEIMESVNCGNVHYYSTKKFNQLNCFPKQYVYLFIYLTHSGWQRNAHLMCAGQGQETAACPVTYLFHTCMFKRSSSVLYLYMLHILEPYWYGITYFAFTLFFKLLKTSISNINDKYIMLNEYGKRYTTCTIPV